MVYKTSVETQKRKDLKKKHIIDTAISVFAFNGYHRTTVKNVVDEANISVGTFYFYFKNKEELFATLYDEVIDEFYETLCASLSNINNEVDVGFSKAIAFFLKAIQCNKPIVKIMLIEAVGLNSEFEKKRAEVTKKFVNYSAGHFEEMKEKNMINVPDIKISALAFIGTLYNVLMDWLQSEEERDITEYAYPITIFNLQALGITYDDEKVKRSINEMLTNWRVP
ncbi:TetR/AcrR family transcriptional regulator [Clostridium sp. 'White wine YQ']|uniref:TetR/AcrR family transcriptional regulator n=1 Tax=Clostridium sp. 'White wine YQ' TaxID=3027474 RepID=UPI002366F255|nr:TetR/AcrR family transcriptional regulator [Clostridium sp. 'White wine YQ']MDD7793093.1 TetR/AcrR family transcriptional regulator [Clostridium sp. 'White wine YQ']